MGGNNSGHHPLAGAVSGACATIASDALMNPFDGENSRHIRSDASDFPISYQTAHAGPRFDVQVNTAVYEIGLQERGPPCILHFVSHNNQHDRSVHRAAVFGLRLHLAISEPFTRLQPYDAYGCRRAGGRLGRGINNTLGCDQDSVANERFSER